MTVPRPHSNGSPAHPAQPREFQAEFFRKMGTLQQTLELMDYLHDVIYFVKDEGGRLIAFSPELARRLGFARNEELIGLTSRDLYPANVADKYMLDDQRVFATGRSMLHIVERWPSPRGGFDWCITNKHPVRDVDGTIIGVMGTLRPYDTFKKTQAEGSNLEKAVEYINEHHRSKITLSQVVKVAGISQRHLNRKFHELFGMSTQEFIIHCRIQTACAALVQRGQNVAQIAAACGFCDQSAFSRQFRKHMGDSPLDYRARYLGKPR